MHRTRRKAPLLAAVVSLKDRLSSWMAQSCPWLPGGFHMLHLMLLVPPSLQDCFPMLLPLWHGAGAPFRRVMLSHSAFLTEINCFVIVAHGKRVGSNSRSSGLCCVRGTGRPHCDGARHGCFGI